MDAGLDFLLFLSPLSKTNKLGPFESLLYEDPLHYYPYCCDGQYKSVLTQNTGRVLDGVFVSYHI
jgi:hypothetical protein